MTADRDAARPPSVDGRGRRAATSTGRPRRRPAGRSASGLDGLPVRPGPSTARSRPIGPRSPLERPAGRRADLVAHSGSSTPSPGRSSSRCSSAVLDDERDACVEDLLEPNARLLPRAARRADGPLAVQPAGDVPRGRGARRDRGRRPEIAGCASAPGTCPEERPTPSACVSASSCRSAMEASLRGDAAACSTPLRRSSPRTRPPAAASTTSSTWRCSSTTSAGGEFEEQLESSPRRCTSGSGCG